MRKQRNWKVVCGGKFLFADEKPKHRKVLKISEFLFAHEKFKVIFEFGL